MDFSDFLGCGIPKYTRTLTVEVPITSNGNGNPFTFPDNTILRAKSVKIYGIEAFDAVAQQVGSSGNTIVPAVADPYIIVNILDTKNANRINQIPYYDLIPYYNTGYPRQLIPFDINLVQSKISLVGNAAFPAATVLPTPPYSALFNFLYFAQQDVIDWLFDCGCTQAQVVALINNMYPQYQITAAKRSDAY
jgi:hypothetical protein